MKVNCHFCWLLLTEGWAHCFAWMKNRMLTALWPPLLLLLAKASLPVHWADQLNQSPPVLGVLRSASFKSIIPYLNHLRFQAFRGKTCPMFTSDLQPHGQIWGWLFVGWSGSNLHVIRWANWCSWWFLCGSSLSLGPCCRSPWNQDEQSWKTLSLLRVLHPNVLHDFDFYSAQSQTNLAVTIEICVRSPSPGSVSRTHTGTHTHAHILPCKHG